MWNTNSNHVFINKMLSIPYKIIYISTNVSQAVQCHLPHHQPSSSTTTTTTTSVSLLLFDFSANLCDTLLALSFQELTRYYPVQSHHIKTWILFFLYYYILLPPQFTKEIFFKQLQITASSISVSKSSLHWSYIYVINRYLHMRARIWETHYILQL